MPSMTGFVCKTNNILLVTIKNQGMEKLKYKVITTKKQYHEFCKNLENLLENSPKSQEEKEEIALLTVLVEKWDTENSTIDEADPIELLRALMAEHKMKSKNLAEILGVSKGLVSDILNYKKGFSKEAIRTLSSHFKLSQEAFNRPYNLKSSPRSHLKNPNIKNPSKALKTATD